MDVPEIYDVLTASTFRSECAVHTFILHKCGPVKPVLRCCKSLLLVLLIMIGTCTDTEAESGIGAIFSTALPVPGWKLEAQPYRYTPQNLYEYINGAAEFFIGFGFIELTGANYASVPENKDAVTVDIYDMGTKLNAFGVFQSRRNGQASSLNFGTAAIGSDDYLAFHKDRFYVEIQAYIISKNEKSVIQTMAAIIARHLPGDNTLPQELSYLPEKGRIAGSEHYIKGGILGHEFLDKGIMCNYQVEGQNASVFIAIMPSYQDAVGAVEQHRSFLNKSGEKCLPLDGFGKHGFISEEPYHKTIIETQAGTFVVGVYDLSTTEAGKTLLENILKNIKQTADK